eukprot:CAMPEP_0194362098 /NCGR_PEP_ID=MMETSP0174-20130528/9775_1 /TAXON_ID=216777 /ORGANISM="Proboscia alata, Strain PI-D3" /LENGTH=219 /DNA_ID=CAMNT_0039134715 /DNA_START=53 /DNA_END=709 /DNA_ORIENTATION=-
MVISRIQVVLCIFCFANLLIGDEVSAFTAPFQKNTELIQQRKAFTEAPLFSAFTADCERGEKNIVQSVCAAIAIFSLTVFSPIAPEAFADASTDIGASTASSAKITTGGASTLQSGRTIAITRGVNLDRSNFKGQNLKGVAFQQSIVRDSDFSGANLVSSSFFDATVDGSNFEGADLTLANVEMAQFNRANLKNAVLHEMYVSGSTLFEGVKDIEGSDW